jgi:glycerol kinase
VSVAMEVDSGVQLELLSVDGGATRNDLLMQIQADLLGCSVQRHRTAELSAVGSGALASIACGFWQEADASVFLSPEGERFSPMMDVGARSAKLEVWKDAVRSAVESRR